MPLPPPRFVSISDTTNRHKPISFRSLSNGRQCMRPRPLVQQLRQGSRSASGTTSTNSWRQTVRTGLSSTRNGLTRRARGCIRDGPKRSRCLEAGWTRVKSKRNNFNHDTFSVLGIFRGVLFSFFLIIGFVFLSCLLACLFL